MDNLTKILMIFVAVLTSMIYSANAQVGIGTTNPAANAMLDIESTDKGFLPPRVDLDDISTEAPLTGTVTAGMIIYNEGGDEPDGLYMWDGTAWVKLNNEKSSHYVGEIYQGGVICWLDNTGEHGLIISMVDQTAAAFSNIELLGNTNNWDGASNTAAITGQSGHTSGAAKICEDYTNADYGTGIYSDWYLPSVAEWNIVYAYLFVLQRTISNDGNPATIPISMRTYWSSTEFNSNAAYGYEIWDGGCDITPKNYNTTFVRAMRAF